MRCNIRSTKCSEKCITLDGSPQGESAPKRKICIFCPIGVKICMMVEVCPYVSFCTFGAWQYVWGSPNRGPKCFFGRYSDSVSYRIIFSWPWPLTLKSLLVKIITWSLTWTCCCWQVAENWWWLWTVFRGQVLLILLVLVKVLSCNNLVLQFNKLICLQTAAGQEMFLFVNLYVYFTLNQTKYAITEH